jgi:two-component system OmpR family sensor kinase
MNSLRRTALIWMTALLSAVGIIAFSVAYEMAREEAAGFLDGQLRQIALNAGGSLTEFDAPSIKHDAEDDIAVSTWDSQGNLVRSAKGGVSLPRQTRQGFANIHAMADDWRVYSVSDGMRSVQAAQRLSVREEMAEAAAFQAGLPILVAIPLAWLVVGWSLGRMLARVANLAQVVANRGIDASENIPIRDVPLEIRPLVEAMNVLSDRLKEALEQQRRFVSDAAHELRTPLAAMQLQLDNLGARSDGKHAGPLRELGNGLRRASNLVIQLLRLARADENTLRSAPELLDLTEMVTQCVADFVPLAQAKGVDLGMGSTDKADITGWPDDLKMLFSNVIANAVGYTPPGGAVDVSVRATSGQITIEVADTGPGVAPGDIPRLTDRFFRAEANDTEGSGLGLSIALAVARRHCLSMNFQNRGDCSGLRVSVTS